MKITFLGTSHGRPEKDRHCSSTMIEVNDSIYLVDVGAPVVDCFYNLGKDATKLKGVFITHLHSDHLDGIFSLVDYVVTRFKDLAFDIVVDDIEIHQLIVTYAEKVNDTAFPKDRIKFILPKTGCVFKDENVAVEYFETKHLSHKKCYGMVIKNADKTAVFSGDLSGGLKGNDFPEYPKNNKTDIFVCEMAHFTADELAEHLAGVNTKLLCVNHINRAEKFADVVALDSSKKFAFPIIAVKDNDEFCV